MFERIYPKMNKRFLSLLLIILLLCAALPCAAFADNTIIANLGKAPAGKSTT